MKLKNVICTNKRLIRMITEIINVMCMIMWLSEWSWKLRLLAMIWSVYVTISMIMKVETIGTDKMIIEICN